VQAGTDIMSRNGAIAPLPGTQLEADAIKADFPSALIHSGAGAQESVAKAQAPRYHFLHFATHGFFNDASPLDSAIVLAQPPSSGAGSEDDGLLTAREIFDLNWPADLVVLSACNTARGGQSAGEGVVGLSWALFVAGAPSQVLSQWAVADASTAQLMKGLYSNLKVGQQKGAALREASLSLMKDGRHAHPYYWAPFVLIGDWR
jgi:CHAT domain-containing protein